MIDRIGFGGAVHALGTEDDLIAEENARKDERNGEITKEMKDLLDCCTQSERGSLAVLSFLDL